MGMSEDTDLSIGKDQTAYQVIVEMTFDGQTERLFGQAAPRLASRLRLVEASPKLLLGHEWLEHGVPDVIGEGRANP